MINDSQENEDSNPSMDKDRLTENSGNSVFGKSVGIYVVGQGKGSIIVTK